MRVCVTTEQRFVQTPDGRVWTPAAFSYSYWPRYFENVFDEVRVIARVAREPKAPASWKRADGDGVTFGAMPSYVGPLQYLSRIRSIGKAVREAINAEDALILRVASQISSCVETGIERSRPFAVEVVTDPYNTFAPGSISHPLRPYFRWHLTRALRRQCGKACAAGYVTDSYLQRHYPPGKSTFSTSYSATELEPDAFRSSPRQFQSTSRPLRIVTVGSLAQMYKGVDILIDAISICAQQGVALELVIVGDGQYRSKLEQLAAQRRIGHCVTFLGALPSGKSVRDQLDAAQLFVLASKTEGLPGAMIEAMARALPCIGSAVGGIPELLSAEDIVPRGHTSALAVKIREVINDPERMTRMSARNLARAQAYSEEALANKRRELLVYLRRATEQWLSRERSGNAQDSIPQQV